MNKIKVIDLLNMISKGEEVPKKIRFENYFYIWRNVEKNYYCKQINHSLESIIGDYLFNNLNLELEIIEEDKKIEKIHENYYGHGNEYLYKMLEDKINEIIDIINKGNNND